MGKVTLRGRAISVGVRANSACALYQMSSASGARRIKSWRSVTRAFNACGGNHAPAPQVGKMSNDGSVALSAGGHKLYGRSSRAARRLNQ